MFSILYIYIYLLTLCPNWFNNIANVISIKLIAPPMEMYFKRTLQGFKILSMELKVRFIKWNKTQNK